MISTASDGPPERGSPAELMILVDMIVARRARS
jgi:hypothetical protein